MLDIYDYKTNLVLLVISISLVIIELAYIFVLKFLKRKDVEPKISLIDSIIYSIIFISYILQFIFLHKLSFISIIIFGAILHCLLFLIDFRK